MTDAVITYDQLRRAEACHKQLTLFKRKFGERVEVTVELAESVAGEFDWRWAAKNLLTDAARDEHRRARAAAWAEYCSFAAPAAWGEYERAKAAALSKYNRARAAAFATAYIAQERGDD